MDGSNNMNVWRKEEYTKAVCGENPEKELSLIGYHAISLRCIIAAPNYINRLRMGLFCKNNTLLIDPHSVEEFLSVLEHMLLFISPSVVKVEGIEWGVTDPTNPRRIENPYSRPSRKIQICESIHLAEFPEAEVSLHNPCYGLLASK